MTASISPLSASAPPGPVDSTPPTSGCRASRVDRAGRGPLQGDAELVAALMRGRHRLSRARRLLDDLGGLPRLAECSERELSMHPGVGQASAASLAASVELARRWHRERCDGRRTLREPREVAAMVRSQLLGACQEHFLAIGVTSRHRVCSVHEAARGSLSHVDVHPREIFRRVVRDGAYAVILAHNHPSGDPTPSGADIELTARMVEAGTLLGIPVLDHVIVAAGGHVSLAAEGLMEPGSRHARDRP